MVSRMSAKQNLGGAMTRQQLTTEEWGTMFQPVINHLNPDASWNDNERGGIMFETYGKEYEYVSKIMETQGRHHVWTWVDGEDGSYIVNGMRLINRIGYFVTTAPWKVKTEIKVDTYGEGVAQ